MYRKLVSLAAAVALGVALSGGVTTPEDDRLAVLEAQVQEMQGWQPASTEPLAGLTKPSSPINQWHTAAVSGSQTIISGAVVRFDDPDRKTPRLHVNRAHLAAGVESVRIDQHGNLHVDQTVEGVDCYPIIGAFAQADETIAGRNGIMVGASGGTGTTRFWFYDTKLDRKLDLTKQADRDRLFQKNANAWLMWVHHVNPGCPGGA